MRATKFVDSYLDAWNHRDPEGVAEHLAPDGIYIDIPENVQRTHDELVDSLYDFFSEFDHGYELIGDVLTNRNTVAFQYRMIPRRESGDGHAQKTFHGAEFVTMQNNVAVMINDYCDMPGSGQPTVTQQTRPGTESRNKYLKSGLNEAQLLEYKNRLEHIMRSEQMYLRSDLTLPKLAGLVNCSVNHLSQVINSGFGVSFFDYLNRYRIDYARELLVQLDGRQNAILNIAFAVGFNSNSAFYAAFKKYVGQTPAQYRKQSRHLHG
jgi:AraC-like DNA-binding protein